MSTKEYDELEKLFNGSWKIVREENMDAFNAAAGMAIINRHITLNQHGINIGIKHGFPCINVCQVPREMLKTEAVGRGRPRFSTSPEGPGKC